MDNEKWEYLGDKTPEESAERIYEEVSKFVDSCVERKAGFSREQLASQISSRLGWKTWPVEKDGKGAGLGVQTPEGNFIVGLGWENGEINIFIMPENQF